MHHGAAGGVQDDDVGLLQLMSTVMVLFSVGSVGNSMSGPVLASASRLVTCSAVSAVALTVTSCVVWIGAEAS